MRPAHLQALFARRREIEHNRIERTAAVNKYFDHWGRVTARFENWTTPEYYQQAEKQLQHDKDQKEKQKRLQERQQQLKKLLEMEKQMNEQELEEKKRNPRRHVDTKMLEKINENMKEEEQMRRKLELEAKLYGKWRHGVEDDNLVFESKTDNEVLAKLNWLDKQVGQQLHKEQEAEKAKERDIQLQHELNKAEELQKERQQIREKEICEIRCLQEYHMEKLKERQQETDNLKENEKRIKNNMEDVEKELELLEESYKVVKDNVDFNDGYNFNKVKIFIRKRSEAFRHQIELCLSIVERTLDIAEKTDTWNDLKKRLTTELEKESFKLGQIESMYESEARYNLKRNEELWQKEHSERYTLIRQALMEEHHLAKAKLNDIMKKHEELLELKSTHLSIIENSSEKLKQLIQEEENSPRQKQHPLAAGKHTGDNIVNNQLEESDNTPLYSVHQESRNAKLHKTSGSPQHSVHFESHRNCEDSVDNNLSPRCSNAYSGRDLPQVSKSFNNLNLDVWESHSHPSAFAKSEMEMEKTNSQRAMQVVTPETEADRPRFGRKHVAWN